MADERRLGELLRREGARLVAELGDGARRADPERTVATGSLLLCAALSSLATAAARALGETGEVADVGRAAALLAWVTKIDDQVIDGLAFHGGPDTPRAQLRAKVEAHLAPTLRSIREGSPADGSPRCLLAADLGERLRRLDADRRRLDELLELIAEGWAIQVDAVAHLTARPAEVSAGQIDCTTASISGAWLLMITAVGSLAPRARRGLTAAERRAFHHWGFHIQRADALADLEKDLGEGLISTWPFHRAWSLGGGAEGARLPADARALYLLIARLGVDLLALPDVEELDHLDAALKGLGAVPRWLRWIHGFLLARYLDHRLSARSLDDPRFEPFLRAAEGWRELVNVGPDDAAIRAGDGEASCSAP